MSMSHVDRGIYCDLGHSRRRRWPWLWANAVLLGGLAVVTPAHAEPQTAATPGPLTVAQALAQARTQHVSVPVDVAQTTTDTVSANPDGTLTLTRSALPVRARVNGAWKALDATLRPNADATLSPTVSTTPLTLSGGGSGPLAVMHADGGRSLALTLPVPLPAPSVAGATATYLSVLPGVDLQVTADTQGGFREVLAVRDASAAANPALRTLALGVAATGVTVSADPAGNLAAVDARGRSIFSAAAPLMWDSTLPAPPVTTLTDPTGRPRDANTGAPVASTSAGPGEAAHVSHVAVAASASAITLTPDQALLTGAGTHFPVYIDPSWSSGKSGWATVTKNHPASNYWNNTPDPEGEMQVGNSGTFWSHTLINFPIPLPALAGAIISAAQFTITETWSFSCTPTPVNVYAPSTTLSPSNATWNSWNPGSLGNAVASRTVAHGYNSGCPAAGVGFDVLPAVTDALSHSRGTQTLVMTGVNEATDHNSWKEFSAASATLAITYNHPPATPTGLSTSPATPCTATPPGTVGDAAVNLNAPVFDPDGENSLQVSFQLWKTSTPATILDSATVTYPSGQTAVRIVPEATLKAASGTAITGFSWHVQVSDGALTSAWSATCQFTFDPTRTGQPSVSPPGSSTIGQPATFTITKPPTGTTPSGYLYQLNGTAPATVPATGGNATITIKPTRLTNTLTVTSLSAGGNIGDAASAVFNSAPADTAPDADLTGDGAADLLAVGATNNLPPGLWQATGRNTGTLVAAATDIGANGNGIAGDNNPSDFTGAQAITGHFTGTGLQDVFTYYPTGTNAGMAVILNGSGDGSALQAQYTVNNLRLTPGTFADINADNPIQLVNAGNTAGQNLPFPDLLGINGDPSIGWYLDYYPNRGFLQGFGTVDQLDTRTPTGGTDWNNWTIATTQLPGGTAMFLRNPTTGALYLWTGLTHIPGSTTLAFTQYTLAAAGWNTGVPLALQAADINADGQPDLWTVGSGAASTAWLTGGLPTTPAITARPAQTLLALTHAWTLNDQSTGAVTTASDGAGTLTATGLGGATWNTGDLYSPDVTLNGVDAAVATSGPALTTNADFTVSAWAKPNSTGGTVLSQDGPHNTGFRLFADTTTNRWTFTMTTSDSNTALDSVQNLNVPARPGIWAHLIATYKASTHTMILYVNGNPSTSTTHNSAWNASGPFQIGRYRNSDTYTGFFNGQLADIGVWNQTLNPTQVANLPATAGSVRFFPDSTFYTSAATWVSDCAAMSFNAGQLSITMTCGRTGTTTFGTSGYPNAVATLQTDGNLVIYSDPSPAGPLWASNTDNHPTDVMYLQPDGNLVIYDNGRVLWASNTNN
jgi:hypothetical protein